MAAEFSWTPPLVVLALGAVAGATVVALRARGKSGPDVAEPAPRQSRNSDLQRQYDALIRRLSEGIPPEERSAVELEAARILMEMETGETRAHPASPIPTVSGPPKTVAAARPPSAITGFVYGALAMGVLGALFYFASQGSTARSEGGSLTGGNTMGAAPSGAPQTDAAAAAELVSLEESVRKTPKDVALRVDLTRAYLKQRDLMKVFDQTQAILEIEPGQPHALTYQALVRVAMGQADQAEKMLVDAIGKNPGIEDAYIHLAIARLQLGNRKGAEAAIEAGQKQFPEDRELLANVFEQIATAAASEGAAPQSDNRDLPETSPEVAVAPPAAGAGSVVVVVDVPKGVAVAPGAILFVMAREAGFDTGAPVAVKRVPAVNFPITVTLSGKDSMAGESLPGLIRIDARIDGDGNPMSKDPRDPVGSEDNVRPGSGQVLLVLTPAKQ